MAPVLASRLKLPFDQPISTKYFGGHKTWRGFIVGFLAALIILYIQKLLLIQNSVIASSISILEYENISVFLYALAFGLGALTGDLVKSFFKRRFNKKPGAMWIPFDQIDFVVGATIFLYPLYQIDIKILLILLVVTPILHLSTNILGYQLRLKRVWY
jgi:CDP-2,3-bis-(O-geranylgeranyl)-sn-glycerol synthase